MMSLECLKHGAAKLLEILIWLLRVVELVIVLFFGCRIERSNRSKTILESIVKIKVFERNKYCFHPSTIQLTDIILRKGEGEEYHMVLKMFGSSYSGTLCNLESIHELYLTLKSI